MRTPFFSRACFLKADVGGDRGSAAAADDFRSLAKRRVSASIEGVEGAKTKMRMAQKAIAARACNPLLERAWRIAESNNGMMNGEAIRKSDYQ